MEFTVKELIEELQCYKEDYVVWIQIDNIQTPITIIKLDEDEEDRLIIE
jgi:hypothetical protein